MDNYRVDEYVRPVASLIDGLSNWYIRRSRRRFWGDGLNEDKKNAYETLYYVLTNTCKLLAPIAPIMAEKIYTTLTGAESVHLCLWPNIPEEFKNAELLKDVDLVQEIIHLARPIRTKNNIKNRQPLQEMFVAFNDDENLNIVKKYKDLICEELNVKNVNFVENVDDIAEINYLPNFSRIGKSMGKNIPVISKALKEKTFARQDGKFVIKGNDEDIVLMEEDVLVNYKAKSNMPVMSDGEVIVSLNLEINAELEQEGVAREIVRNVQDARKLLNCNITDRISLEINGDLDSKWIDYVCRETLADQVKVSNKDYEFKLEDKEIEVFIELKRN
jgi:isoleucyl-tRNA synthetase